MPLPSALRLLQIYLFLLLLEASRATPAITTIITMAAPTIKAELFCCLTDGCCCCIVVVGMVVACMVVVGTVEVVVGLTENSPTIGSGGTTNVTVHEVVSTPKLVIAVQPPPGIFL